MGSFSSFADYSVSSASSSSTSGRRPPLDSSILEPPTPSAPLPARERVELPRMPAPLRSDIEALLLPSSIVSIDSPTPGARAPRDRAVEEARDDGVRAPAVLRPRAPWARPPVVARDRLEDADERRLRLPVERPRARPPPARVELFVLAMFTP
jgi:hypothetical protein